MVKMKEEILKILVKGRRFYEMIRLEKKAV